MDSLNRCGGNCHVSERCEAATAQLDSSESVCSGTEDYQVVTVRGDEAQSKGSQVLWEARMI